eukprot:TRINITY_DN25819_c0_g2_i4.p2 TRINITY_DN25819_c0_g2~~TRINITY_DN25819_c0_g2_i4.p2  ORF type:complete len:958 (-),score=207.63 TRINITY_DN25819_c0_g2_i4:58-2931(-)
MVFNQYSISLLRTASACEFPRTPVCATPQASPVAHMPRSVPWAPTPSSTASSHADPYQMPPAYVGYPPLLEFPFGPWHPGASWEAPLFPLGAVDTFSLGTMPAAGTCDVGLAGPQPLLPEKVPCGSSDPIAVPAPELSGSLSTQDGRANGGLGGCCASTQPMTVDILGNSSGPAPFATAPCPYAALVGRIAALDGLTRTPEFNGIWGWVNTLLGKPGALEAGEDNGPIVGYDADLQRFTVHVLLDGLGDAVCAPVAAKVRFENLVLPELLPPCVAPVAGEIPAGAGATAGLDGTCFQPSMSELDAFGGSCWNMAATAAAAAGCGWAPSAMYDGGMAGEPCGGGGGAWMYEAPVAVGVDVDGATAGEPLDSDLTRMTMRAIGNPMLATSTWAPSCIPSISQDATRDGPGSQEAAAAAVGAHAHVAPAAAAAAEGVAEGSGATEGPATTTGAVREASVAQVLFQDAFPQSGVTVTRRGKRRRGRRGKSGAAAEVEAEAEDEEEAAAAAVSGEAASVAAAAPGAAAEMLAVFASASAAVAELEEAPAAAAAEKEEDAATERGDAAEEARAAGGDDAEEECEVDNASIASLSSRSPELEFLGRRADVTTVVHAEPARADVASRPVEVTVVVDADVALHADAVVTARFADVDVDAESCAVAEADAQARAHLVTASRSRPWRPSLRPRGARGTVVGGASAASTPCDLEISSADAVQQYVVRDNLSEPRVGAAPAPMDRRTSGADAAPPLAAHETATGCTPDGAQTSCRRGVVRADVRGARDTATADGADNIPISCDRTFVADSRSVRELAPVGEAEAAPTLYDLGTPGAEALRDIAQVAKDQQLSFTSSTPVTQLGAENTLPAALRRESSTSTSSVHAACAANRSDCGRVGGKPPAVVPQDARAAGARRTGTGAAAFAGAVVSAGVAEKQSAPAAAPAPSGPLARGTSKAAAAAWRPSLRRGF